MKEDCIKIEEWRRNKERLTKLKRKREEEDWKTNGGNELLGETVTEAVKDITLRTCIEAEKNRKFHMVSG